MAQQKVFFLIFNTLCKPMNPAKLITQYDHIAMDCQGGY